MKTILCLGLGLALTAMMAIASDVSTNSVSTNSVSTNAVSINDVTGRIESTSASVKNPVVYGIYASCTYCIKTSLPRVKQPMLKLIVCYEGNDGVRHNYESYGGSGSLGWNRLRNDHERQIGVAGASKNRTEVESAGLHRVTVKGESADMFQHIKKGTKVIAVRSELWFDGAMLCNDNPQNNIALSKLGLPEDWYIKGKYPDKISYEQ